MMMNPPSLYDLAPLARIAGIGLLLALGPLAWVWLRHRNGNGNGNNDDRPGTRLHALTLLTLFLTFDLVLFGAFTRLTDSGLGCPDWPGCYGSATPFGAGAGIAAAERAMPTGPVSHTKAWIEMTHRYLATAVGVLILVLAGARWARWFKSPRPPRSASSSAASPWWATVTVVWVCLQGAFGALTVTMKLYPAIVTAHLLGGLGLLALLGVQSQAHRRGTLSLPPRLHAGALAVAMLAVLQIALGGWVSTNYAVLACRDFPACQQSFWPEMDFANGFAIFRALGVGADGGFLPFPALTAIHYAHRLGAYVVLGSMLLFAWRLRANGEPPLRRWAGVFLALALWQLASGLGNVLLGWPLVAAVAHTAGAAALVVSMAALLTRAHRGAPSPKARAARPGLPARAAS